MRIIHLRILAVLIITILLGTAVTSLTTATSTNDPLAYWYIGNNFDLIQEDNWVPFFSLTDVPYSLPLRGFISDTRNYFLDFGAVDWLSDWIQYRYNWPISEYERSLVDDNAVEQLEFLYETITSRLIRPISYVDEARDFIPLDYVKDFEAPFEAFIPLIVMYGLDESYDNAQMRDWVIHPDIVEESLNNAFPLVEWTTELYWFDYNNATQFGELMFEKTIGNAIWMDEDFISQCDTILHDIIFEDSRYVDSDVVLPTLMMLQEHTLLAATYDPAIAVGGLGRLYSAYPEIDSWCLNGRSVESYFFAGDPESPRTSITPTVVHELGHCIGQSDVHSSYGWFSAASSMSVMGAYQQPTVFDSFDVDLVTNGMALQLWGRYLDEIDYFRDLNLNSTQITEIETLEESLSSVPHLLITRDTDTLKQLLYDADSIFCQLSDDLGESRKSDGWSDNAPSFDLQIEWIIGSGIPDAENIATELESEIETQREIIPLVGTTLPTPRYNVSIGIHSTTDPYDEAMLIFWGLNMVEANTSTFDSDEVPDDAFTSWPRNRVFQNQSGYAIDGSVVERWLEGNPFTPNNPDRLHYRFYILNLENVTPISQNITGTVLIVLAVGSATFIVVAGIVVMRRRKS